MPGAGPPHASRAHHGASLGAGPSAGRARCTMQAPGSANGVSSVAVTGEARPAKAPWIRPRCSGQMMSRWCSASSRNGQCRSRTRAGGLSSQVTVSGANASSSSSTSTRETASAPLTGRKGAGRPITCSPQERPASAAARPEAVPLRQPSRISASTRYRRSPPRAIPGRARYTTRGRPGPEGSSTIRSITPSAISAPRWKRAVLGWMPACPAISEAPSGAGDR